MYHRTLAVGLFTQDPLLEQVWGSLEPLERFEHAIRVHDAFHPEYARQADVLVLDCPLDAALPDIRAMAKPGASVVLCADAPAAERLSGEDLAALDAVWTRPFSPELLAFHARNLLRQLKIRQDFRLTQAWLDTAIDSIPDLVWFKDVRGAHLKVNNGFCHAVGKTKKDVEGRGHYYIWGLKKEEYEQGEYVCLETEEIVLRERKTCLFDEKVKSRQGMRQFKTYKSPIFDEDGSVIGTVGIAHDVTDLANMAVELEIFLHSVPFAVVVGGEDGRIVKINAKVEEYLGVAKDQVVGQEYAEWKRQTLGDVACNGLTGGMEATVWAHGEKRILEIHEEDIVDIFQTVIGELCVLKDVTSEHAFAQQVVLNANTDSLTGLWNRRYFYTHVQERRGQEPLGLLYVDLDNFKMVNDRYGHQRGDEALVMVAGMIRSFFPDEICARLGGDEFVVCVPGLRSVESMQEKAAAFLHALNGEFGKSDVMRSITVSIGIAEAREPSVSLDELIRRGDAAMYEAKKRGKSRYCVYAPPPEIADAASR